MYEVSYPEGLVLRVLGSEDEPSPPRVLHAIFSDSGNFITLSFDVSTNQGKLGNNIFQCSRLLSFRTSNLDLSPRCVWGSNRLLDIYSSGDSGLKVGENVTLLSGVLKAECISVVDRSCSSWQFSSSESVKVLSALNPLRPNIHISGPSLIGSCVSLIFDLLGSSGSGGRSWKSLSMSVSQSGNGNGDNGNMDVNVNGTLNLNLNLQSVLDQVNVVNMSRPLMIGSEYFSSNTAYTFTIRVCNFLDACSQQSYQVLVSSSTLIPLVSLNSQSYRTIDRRSWLSVSGSAYTVGCDSNSNLNSGSNSGSSGKQSTSSLGYSWRLQRNGVMLTDAVFQSRSVNPKVFQLPPYILSVGELYVLTLSVKSSISQRSSSTSMSIFVESGKIYALISGGNDVGLPVDGMIVVDGSLSYDEDQSGVFGLSAGLSYSFVCVQIEPFHSADCGSTLLMEPLPIPLSVSGSDSSGASSLRLSPLSSMSPSNLIGSIYEITMFVKSESGSRISSTLVKVTILDALAPVVSITSATGSKINPSSKLKLLGTITMKVRSSLSGMGMWSMNGNDNSMGLSSISLSPLEKKFSSDPSSSSSSSSIMLSMVLVLSSYSLPEQSSFTFSLSCRLDSGLTTTSSIEITTNSPPLPGLFVLSPDRGEMLSTEFSYIALNWEDSDIPITYEFSKGGPGGMYLVFRSRQEKSHATSLLSSGDPLQDYKLSNRLQVFDSYDAASTSYSTVVVNPVSISSLGLQDFLTSAVKEANGDPDSLRSAMSTISSGVNEVNCSGYGLNECKSLNRESCVSESFRCG